MTDVEQLLQAHRPSLMHQAYLLTHDRYAAEDLVQETYLKALRAWDSFDGRNLRGWLGRILFNAFATETRRNRNRPVPIGDTKSLQFQCRGAAPGADDEHLARTIDPLVVSAFHALSAVHQQLVFLVDVQGDRPIDVARATGVNKTTVNTRLHRARQQLREELEGTADAPVYRSRRTR